MIKTNGVDLCTQAFGDPANPALLLIMGATASMVRWPENLVPATGGLSGLYVIRCDNRDTHSALRADDRTYDFPPRGQCALSVLTQTPTACAAPRWRCWKPSSPIPRHPCTQPLRPRFRRANDERPRV